MGAAWSYFWPSNDPDPVTGLTPREKYLVTSSFSVIKKDLQGSGIMLFMMLFERNPEYQNYFPFRDIPREKLPKSPKFKAHAISVMYALSSLVENLDNGDVLIHLLQKTAESHAQRRVPIESFGVVEELLLDVVKRCLGTGITEEGLDAWRNTLSVAIKVIVTTVKEVSKK